MSPAALSVAIAIAGRSVGRHVPAVAGTSSRKTYGEGLLSRKKQNDLSCVFEMYEQMQIW